MFLKALAAKQRANCEGPSPVDLKVNSPLTENRSAKESLNKMHLTTIPAIHKRNLVKNGDKCTRYGAVYDAIQQGSFGRSNHHGDFPHEMSRVAK